jgi:predicted secreted protein
MKKLIAITVLLLLIFTVFPGCQSQPDDSTGPSPSSQPATPVAGPSNASPPPLENIIWRLDYATIKYDSQGNELWVARYNGLGNNIDEANALAVDGAGNIYVTGGSRSERGNGIREDYATIKYGGNGNELWVARYTGPGDGDNTATALAVDGKGNVYVTGQSNSQKGDLDFATVKYDSHGRELWVARYNGPGNNVDGADALVVDSKGNVYVTGNSRGNKGHDDYATIKYDANGNELWVARYDDGSSTAMAVDSVGNVYVTGFSRANNDLNGYLTIKYDNVGNQLWTAAYNFPGSGDHVAYAIAVDKNGSVYVTGRSIGDSYDYATVKYDSDGNELWVARYNGPANRSDQASSIAVDADGNVYVTGRSDNENRERDYTTLKYDADGKLLWEARYTEDGYGDGMATALAVDDSGNVYVTGQSYGNNSGWDYATIKYDSNGKQLWSARYNGPANSLDRATFLAIDSEGNVHVIGSSSGTAGVPITTQSPWPDVSVYIDVTQVIKTRTGDEIAFGFETGTRLGLGWNETHDENMVSLVDRELVMNQTGISGTTWFLFKALKPGESRITFVYGHGGGGPVADTKEFRIEIEE